MWLAVDLCQKWKKHTNVGFNLVFVWKKNEKSTIVVTRNNDGKAGKTDGPLPFFRFHRPCQSFLLVVRSGSGGTWIWMGWSWMLGTFKGGLDSVKGEECVGGSLFVELSTWFCCPRRLTHYHSAVVSPSKNPLYPPLRHARTRTPTVAHVCM